MVPDGLIMITLHRVHAALDASLNAALAEVDLSAAQWDLLRYLHHCPGASGAEIARYAKVTPQAVATMLQRMEKSGLLTRRAAPKGRVVGTYLTTKGEAALAAGNRIAHQVNHWLLAGLTIEQQQQLENLLKTCQSALEHHPPADT